MTDREIAESMLRGFTKEIGVELPVAEIVQLGAFLLSKTRGATWADAIQAGVDARIAIDSEEAAERSRRARMEGP